MKEVGKEIVEIFSFSRFSNYIIVVNNELRERQDFYKNHNFPHNTTFFILFLWYFGLKYYSENGLLYFFADRKYFIK